MPVLLYHRDCGLFLCCFNYVFCSVLGAKIVCISRGLSFPCCHVIVCWLGCCFYTSFFSERVVKLFIFCFSTKHTLINTHTHIYLSSCVFLFPVNQNIYIYISTSHIPVRALYIFHFHFLISINFLCAS